MPQRFNGVVDLDIRDSVPDWSPFLARRAPEGAPNVLALCGEGLCIGYDGGDSVTRQYPLWFPFTDDRYLDLERQLRAAIARD